MKKRITAVLLSILMVMSMSVQINAAAVTPRWSNMTQVTIDIEFSDDNVGNASVLASKVFGITTSIEGTLHIYYDDNGSWKYLNGASGEENGSLYLEVEFDAESGTKYLAVADLTAHSKTSSESETLTKTSTCP